MTATFQIPSSFAMNQTWSFMPIASQYPFLPLGQAPYPFSPDFWSHPA